jgi:hypothetical protein
MKDFDIALNESQTDSWFSVFFQGEFHKIPIKFMRVSERKGLSDLLRKLCNIPCDTGKINEE